MRFQRDNRNNVRRWTRRSPVTHTVKGGKTRAGCTSHSPVRPAAPPLNRIGPRLGRAAKQPYSSINRGEKGRTIEHLNHARYRQKMPDFHLKYPLWPSGNKYHHHRLPIRPGQGNRQRRQRGRTCQERLKEALQNPARDKLIFGGFFGGLWVARCPGCVTWSWHQP